MTTAKTVIVTEFSFLFSSFLKSNNVPLPTKVFSGRSKNKSYNFDITSTRTNVYTWSFQVTRFRMSLLSLFTFALPNPWIVFKSPIVNHNNMVGLFLHVSSVNHYWNTLCTRMINVMEIFLYIRTLKWKDYLFLVIKIVSAFKL